MKTIPKAHKLRRGRPPKVRHAGNVYSVNVYGIAYKFVVNETKNTVRALPLMRDAAHLSRAHREYARDALLRYLGASS